MELQTSIQWRSIIELRFSTESKFFPHEAYKRLLSLGFRQSYDKGKMIFDWEKGTTMNDIINLANSVHSELSGLNIQFKLHSEKKQAKGE